MSKKAGTYWQRLTHMRKVVRTAHLLALLGEGILLLLWLPSVLDHALSRCVVTVSTWDVRSCVVTPPPDIFIWIFTICGSLLGMLLVGGTARLALAAYRYINGDDSCESDRCSCPNHGYDAIRSGATALILSVIVIAIFAGVITASIN